MSTYLPKILITGSEGQLGTALCHHPLARQYSLVPRSHQQLDITRLSDIEQAFSVFRPDIVINTAAYTAVDKAEHEKALVNEVNAMGVQQLAMMCGHHQIPLIHFSTDYIFDGEKKSPYLEEDLPNPINNYGHSKWLGEQSVRQYCAQHIILRVSGVFSEHGKNFFKTILQLAKEKKALGIVADQISCPTFASDTAFAVYSILQKLSFDPSPAFGTYHYCGTPSASWYEFAYAIIDLAKQYQGLLVEEVKAISTSEYAGNAKRPAYSVLDCEKIAKDYGLQQPSWINSLRGMIHEYLSTP